MPDLGFDPSERTGVGVGEFVVVERYERLAEFLNRLARRSRSTVPRSPSPGCSRAPSRPSTNPAELLGFVAQRPDRVIGGLRRVHQPVGVGGGRMESAWA